MDIEDYKFGVARQARLDAKEDTMDIDFAKIIETANTRKDTIIQIDELLKEVAQHACAVERAGRYSNQLLKAFRSLDEEGCRLLPPPVRTALESCESIVTSLERATMASYGGSRTGLRHLAEVTGYV